MIRLGILSDTHGLLRPAVLKRLAGCDHLVHAGDVGEPQILDQLATVAPVTAVYGNTDHGPLRTDLPFHAERDFEDVTVRITHRREDVPGEWLRQRQGLIVFGHSHRPELEWHGGVVLLNPGACGARRFDLPLTVAIVGIDGKRIQPEILSIEA